MGSEANAGGFERVIIAVDDTDDVSKATSTGLIAQLAADEVVGEGGEVILGITRHQLLLRDDVPYTSHNSAMAFEARIPHGAGARILERVERVVDANRAESANPGICLVRLDAPGMGGEDPGWEPLVEFGLRAQVEFCPVPEAVALAARLEGVVLEQRGGNGDGMVGALAGAGLRMTGADGRFRGKWVLRKRWRDVDAMTVREAVGRLEAEVNGPVHLLDERFGPLDPDLALDLDAAAKPLMHEGALVMVCQVRDGVAHPLEKDDLGPTGGAGSPDTSPCARFEWDNDANELKDGVPSCLNCLYRRWLGQGFRCVLGERPGRGAGKGRHGGRADAAPEERTAR